MFRSNTLQKLYDYVPLVVILTSYQLTRNKFQERNLIISRYIKKKEFRMET